MKIVVDTNIIVSALIKEGIIRDIILSKDLHLVTVSFTLSKIWKHKEEICEKAGISLRELFVLLDITFKYIKIVNSSFYNEYIEQAKSLIKDIKDVPFLACAIALGCPIWSEDKHFDEQDKVKILKTKDIIGMVL